MSSKLEKRYLAKLEVEGEILTEHRSAVYFEYKVRNFFSRCKEADDYFYSPPFHFFNATWRIRIYPFGRTESDSVGWIGLYIFKEKSVTPKQLVTYKLGIKKADGTEYEFFTSGKDFEQEHVGWGKPLFIQRDTLLKDKKKVAPCETVIFFCSLRVQSKKGKDEATQTILPEEFHELEMKPERLIEGSDGDVILIIKGRKFWAHKDILKARSSVFDQELRESVTDVIYAPDCNPEAFKEFLLYLYYGKEPEFSHKRVYDLFLVADFYGVRELREECLEFIIKNISMDEIYDVLYLSVECNDPTIMNHANNFISAHTIETITKKRWLQFLRDYPVQANEIYVKALQNNVCK